MRVVLVLLVIASCGRFGFAPPDRDAAPVDTLTTVDNAATSDAGPGGCGTATPYTIGNAVEFTDSSTHTANFIFGSKVTVTCVASLQRISLIARSSGIQGQLVLYRDDGMNSPGALVAHTSPFVSVPGVMELPPTAATTLTVGEYWLAGVYQQTMSVAQHTVNLEVDSRWRAHTFGTPLPDPFGVASTEQAQRANYYLVVRDL